MNILDLPDELFGVIGARLRRDKDRFAGLGPFSLPFLHLPPPPSTPISLAILLSLRDIFILIVANIIRSQGDIGLCFSSTLPSRKLGLRRARPLSLLLVVFVSLVLFFGYYFPPHVVISSSSSSFLGSSRGAVGATNKRLRKLVFSIPYKMLDFWSAAPIKAFTAFVTDSVREAKSLRLYSYATRAYMKDTMLAKAVSFLDALPFLKLINPALVTGLFSFNRFLFAPPLVSFPPPHPHAFLFC